MPSAEEHLRLVMGRFDVGKGTAVELIDTQHGQTLTRFDDVRARVARDRATTRVIEALGPLSCEPREDAVSPERK